MTRTPPDPDLPGPADSSPAAQGDPVRLLVSAVGQLPAEQRDLVLTWPLGAGSGSGSGVDAPELQALRRVVAGQPLRGMAPTAQQVVPVRFPTQQHAQLREWCAEHGFSMATVIRGLVARFLEGQLPEHN